MQELIKVHFTDGVERIDGLGFVVPREALVVTPFGFDHLLLIEQTHGVRVVQDHRPYPYVKRWRPDSALAGVAPVNAAFTQSGGMGDELVYSAFTWQLRYDYPQMRVTNYVSGANRYMAYGSGRQSVSTIGWRVAEIERHDAWITPAPVSFYRRGEPESIYTMIATELGVTPRYARPHVSLTAEEIEDVWRHLAMLPQSFRENFVLIQLAASDPLRTPDGWHIRLRMLMDALDARSPATWVAITGDVATVGLTRLRSGLAKHPRLVDFPYGGSNVSLSPRTILYLASLARVVITPDSMLLHGAAAFDTPCVALWNLGNGGSLADAPDAVPPERDPLTTARRLARERNPYLSHVSAVPGHRPEDVVPPPSSRVSTYPHVTVVDMAMHPQVMVDCVAAKVAI